MLQRRISSLQKAPHSLLHLRSKIERFLHGDSFISQFVRGVSWSLVGAVVSRGLTLGATILAARMLGITSYGELGMIQATVLVFAASGLSVSLTKQVAELRNVDLARTEKQIGAGLSIATLFGIASGIFLFVLSDTIASRALHAPDLAQGIRIGAVLTTLTVIGGAQIGILIGLQEFRAVALLQAVRSASIGIGLIVGSFFGTTGALVGLSGGEAISVLISTVMLYRISNLHSISTLYGPFDWIEARQLCSFALPVFLSGMVMQPAVWFSNLFLASQPAGYSRLGIFVAAEKWRELALFVPGSISQAVLALLSNLHGTQNTKSYADIFRLNILVHIIVILVTAIGLAFFSRLAMAAFGTEFVEGWGTLSILALSAIPIVLNNVLGQVLQSAGLVWHRFFLDVLLATLYTTLAVVLIPRWFENGLAIASLLAFAVTATVLYLRVRQVMARIHPSR